MGITATVLSLALLVALVGLGWATATRRDLGRRVRALGTRLGAELEDLDAVNDLAAALAFAERAADSALARADDGALAVQRLGEALSRVSEGIVVCDPRGEIVYRNERADAYIGTRHAEALAREAVTAQLAAAVEGRRASVTLELFGPPRRTLAIHASPIDDGGQRLGAVAVVEDVSERRRLEAVRRDFVANISHELKTPVGALGLLAETILDEDDPVIVRRFAARMQAESFRVSGIIDDLLDLSRIEAEEMPQREPMAVEGVVAQAIDRAQPMAERRQITIRFAEAPPGWTVVGDRRQLVSAIHNLIENAVKYSDDDSIVQVSVDGAADRVEIAVLDHGIGIPSRDLERIFERFYRVDRARARDTGGTGLGLAIVRHVASNHGGEVRVTSLEGIGSTFTLCLPGVARAAAVAVAEAG